MRADLLGVRADGLLHIPYQCSRFAGRLQWAAMVRLFCMSG